MKSILSVFIAAKLVVGSPIVIVLPTEKGTNRKQSGGTKNVDFGRNIPARQKDHRDLLSDKTGKLSRRQLDTSKVNHTPKKATKFQDTDVTGLLDFDNPLEDIFTSRVHIKNLARRLGKSSKSKSKSTPSWGGWQSPDIPSSWQVGKSSKSKSEKSAPSPVWNGWHVSNGHEGGKSSKSKSKSKSSTWNGWQASHNHGGKSSKSKSKSWGGWHTSSSASKSSKVHAYKSSTSFDFSYQITSYESWSLDEERDTTLPVEETFSPVASPASELHEHVEPKPREETTLFSETESLEPNSVSIFDVSSATEPRTVDKEEGKNNQMYYVAAAASFGGLVAFFAAVFLKRRGVRSHDSHMKLNDEATSAEATLSTSSNESQSHNHTNAPSEMDETCEWSQPDAWLAMNMK